jgi:hypothetical protein
MKPNEEIQKVASCIQISILHHLAWIQTPFLVLHWLVGSNVEWSELHEFNQFTAAVLFSKTTEASVKTINKNQQVSSHIQNNFLFFSLCHMFEDPLTN